MKREISIMIFKSNYKNPFYSSGFAEILTFVITAKFLEDF
jgi:hypothetical protein